MGKVVSFKKEKDEDNGKYDSVENYILARLKEEGYEPVDYETLSFIVRMFLEDMKIGYNE